MLHIGVTKEAEVFLPVFPEVQAQPHAHLPAWVSWVHHYFLVISPVAGAFLSVWDTRGLKPSAAEISDTLSHLSQQSSLPTQ